MFEPRHEAKYITHKQVFFPLIGLARESPTAYGVGHLVGVQAQGDIFRIEYAKPTWGFYYFAPSGVGLLRKDRVVCLDERFAVANEPFMLPSLEERRKYLIPNPALYSVRSDIQERSFSSDMVRDMVRAICFCFCFCFAYQRVSIVAMPRLVSSRNGIM